MSLASLLLFILLPFTAYTQTSAAKALKILMEQWKGYKNECIQNIINAPPATGLVCNRTFDQYACWPDGLPGTTVNVSCPWYLPWYHKVRHGLVYHVCGPDGQWAPKNSKNTSECEEDDQWYGRILDIFRTMYTVGYSLSLGALVLALSILAAFRKLHCMRNNIHMNLFASFILRALSILIKDALLDAINANAAQLSTSHTHAQRWTNSPQLVSGCRVAVVMMQYSVVANNYWLLVEGIYLHNLLVVTVFSEKNYFHIYLCIGWGAPLMFVLPWVIVKQLYEDEECWERNVNMGYWWIIRSPILFAYLINFFIFIRIIKILMSKLKAHQMRYTDYKFRLAKSTLTLIPLLGIHAILFTFVIDESVPKESLLRLIRLFYDLLFSSFQGLLVAILYCFVNKEVQSEVVKRWKRWKLGKDIEEEYRHTHSQTPHGKSASVVMAAPPSSDSDPQDSDPPPPDPDPDPHDVDSDLQATPSSSPPTLAWEEREWLVGVGGGGGGGSRKCNGKGGGEKRRVILSSSPIGGLGYGSGSLTEDICLQERRLPSGYGHNKVDHLDSSNCSNRGGGNGDDNDNDNDDGDDSVDIGYDGDGGRALCREARESYL
ncbi:glucagon receptor-like [Engraulis encrasicolus]|uniref:glucagon receptor-like n=1 Tax=Engraulis encrasicolus TaxID=184585 RepID=UPI002FD458C5